tara:strand:- start:6305 stop:6706 length:402 start_codon:yes stop_codon:yes gene_type:complete
LSELRSDANHCFVCGQGNPIGLHLHFRLEGDDCVSEFTPGADHCGYDGVTHGGIIYSALDDVMANWLFLKGLRAYTARCEIRYRGPLAVGTPVTLTGQCLKQRGRLAVLTGTMRKAGDGEILAETEASFMIEA